MTKIGGAMCSSNFIIFRNLFIYTFLYSSETIFRTFARRNEWGRVKKKNRKKTEEEREIAEGLGLVRFMRTDEVFAVDSVCTYDPKILQSFPFGQASRESQWAHRSSDSFLPHERSGPPVPPSLFPHPSHQFIGFLAANGYNRHYRVKCAPTKLKIGF